MLRTLPRGILAFGVTACQHAGLIPFQLKSRVLLRRSMHKSSDPTTSPRNNIASAVRSARVGATSTGMAVCWLSLNATGDSLH